MKLILFFFLLIFSFSIFCKNLKVVLIDSFICGEILANDFKNVNLIAKTGTIKCGKNRIFKREIHGDFVLRSFLEGLKKDKQITLIHFNVFKEDGTQDFNVWKYAFKFAREIKVDLIFSASSYVVSPKDKVEKVNFPSMPFLIAAPTRGRGITEKSKLWPNNYYKEKLIKIGDAIIPSNGKRFPPVFNRSLLNNEIDFYVPLKREKVRGFGGSSKAVAKAAAISVNECFKKGIDLKKCLLHISKMKKFSDDKSYKVFDL